MKKAGEKLTRGNLLKHMIALPAPASVMAAGDAVPAMDKPGPHGQKCSQRRFFTSPSACSIVTGKISPNGWCIAWAKK